jgi:hypothetical protein
MSKYIWLLISHLALISIVSCQMKVEPMITANIDECGRCTMIIQDIDQGAVMIDAEEQLHTYCNPVCMLLDKKNIKADRPSSNGAKYLFDHNSISAIPVSGAFIVHGDFNTAMGHGLLAFAKKDEADQFAKEVDGEILSWNELRIRHELPDISINLPNDSQNIEVTKDDLISVIYYNNTSDEVAINLLGYELQMTVPAKSTDTALFIASKPGQGFVFQKNNEESIVTLFVTGEHTPDEANYK